MSYIQLSQPQSFNNYTNPEPQYQDWGSPLLSEIYYNPNGQSITPPLLLFQIKDFITPEYGFWFDKRIVLTQTQNSFVQVLPLSGMGSNPYTILNNGLTFTQTPNFQNLQLLPDGVYEHQYIFKVQGRIGPFLAFQDIPGTDHVFTIRLIKSSTALIWSPLNFSVIHQQGMPFQYYEINIDGPSWQLISPQEIILESDDISVTILPGFPEPGYRASGSGAKVVKFRLSNDYDTGTPEPSSLNHNIVVRFGSNQQVGLINVDINILVNEFIFSNLTSMHFIAYKGLQEPIAQFVGVSAVISPIENDKSPWLTIQEASSPNGQLPFQNGYNIKPIATSNMSVGFYTGFVRLYVENTDPTNFPIGQYSRTIAITYQLLGDIVSPYNNNKIALTLTPAFYQFFAQLQNTYFDMRINLKVFDFQNNESNREINLKVALFEQKAKEFLGKFVHRLMAVPPLSNSLSTKPAQLTIHISEKDVLTHESIRSFSSTMQKFIAGFNENRLGNLFLKSQILNINRNPKRVYNNQYYYLSWYQEEDAQTIFEQKRNAEDVFLGFFNVANESVNCKNFKINANQSDVINLKIYENPDNLSIEDLVLEPEQIETLVCFPPPKHWHDIVWVDEFKLLKNFIFGGDFTVESEKQFIQNRNYNGVFEALENIDMNNIKKLIINTGWMLKTDAETIDSLMNSQKAWLVKSYWNNGAIQESFEITPISKKIIHENSTDMTIEMTVEFEITPIR